MAFSAVFTIAGPQTAQAAAKPNTAALGYNPCAPGTISGPSQCDCPSGYVFQSVSGPDPVFGCVLSSVVGFTDVAGTIIQPVVSKSNCQLFADAALSIPAKNKDGSDVLVTPHSTWPEKATIAPNVDLVSVVGQALYTDASCFNDVRTAVISTDKTTLTIYKGGVAWKTLSAPTGETITTAKFNSGLVVTFNNPNGVKPDTKALIDAAEKATAAGEKAEKAAKAAANDANDANATKVATAAAAAAKAAAAAANYANAKDAANVTQAAQAATYAAADAAKVRNYATSTDASVATVDAYASAADAKAATYAAAKATQDFATAWQNNVTPTVTYTLDQINAWSNA